MGPAALAEYMPPGAWRQLTGCAHNGSALNLCAVWDSGCVGGGVNGRPCVTVFPWGGGVGVAGTGLARVPGGASKLACGRQLLVRWVVPVPSSAVGSG